MQNSSNPATQQGNFSPIDSTVFQDKVLAHAIGRLLNYTGSAEGTNMPPPQVGEFRVPFVSKLEIIKRDTFLGGTAFTLRWLEPDGTDTKFISHYNIYVKGIDGNTRPNGPYAATKSPAVVRVTTNNADAVTLVVQTVLNNGLVSDPERSPSVSNFTIKPEIPANAITGPVSGALAGSLPSPTLVGVSPTFVTYGSGTTGILASSSAFTYVSGLLTTPRANTLAGGLPVNTGGVLHVNTTTTGNSGAAETTLFAFSLPANTLNTHKSSLDILGSGRFAATAANKRLRLYLGATLVFDSGALAVTAASAWKLSATLVSTGAATGKLVTELSFVSAAVANLVAYTTTVENFTGALALDLTAQATANDDIFGDFYRINYLP